MFFGLVNIFLIPIPVVNIPQRALAIGGESLAQPSATSTPSNMQSGSTTAGSVGNATVGVRSKGTRVKLLR